MEEEASDSSQEMGAGRYMKTFMKRRRQCNNSDSTEKRSFLSQKTTQKKDGRVRNLKFTHSENLAIIEHLLPVFDKRIGSKMLKTESAWKIQLWQKIIKVVNAVGIFPRSGEHIRKRYKDIKGTIKKKLSDNSKERYANICILSLFISPLQMLCF